MKNVMLRITGRHVSKDSGEDEQIEFVTEGRAYEKNGSIYVFYEESELSEMPGLRTTMKIDKKGDVRLKRSGDGRGETSIMEFSKGRRFSSLYHTPYGPLEMEILTNRIVNEVSPESLTGNILIDYDIALRGLAESRTLLHMELYEAGVPPVQ